MTDPIREGQRVPRSDAPQGVDRWARRGVQELIQRDAEERAEMGDPDAGPHDRADERTPGRPFGTV